MGVPLVAADHPQAGDSGETITFDHRTGNEWWVEVNVRLVTNEPESIHVDRVEARDDGGPWVQLSLKSWGAYAASFHIEPGHRVQFRAAQHGGMSDARVWTSCWFTHPAGVEQCETGTSPPPPAFTFAHGGGNEWWVEAKVSPMPGKVEAMDTGGAWTPLSFRSWGEWANSFHIEPGNQVKFRALAPDGVWHESCWFTHPAGVMTPCGGNPLPPAWPVEGSFVTYYAYDGESFPNYWMETEINATFTYTGGQWSLVCEGNTHEEVERWNSTSGETEWAVTDEPFYHESVGHAPPLGPADAQLGAFASVGGLPCMTGGAEGTVFGPVRVPTVQNGSEVEVTAYFLEYEPVWPAYESGSWDAKTRLALDWGFGGSHGYWGGWLTDTDAPLAAHAPARTSWPFEGSFVHYQANATGSTYRSDMRFTFEDGGWTLNCTVYDGATVLYSFDTPDAPWHAPPGVAVGDGIEVPLIHYCSEQWNELLVERTQSVMTTRNGVAYKAKAWYADEDDSWTEVDFDVWWDANTRLYLEWDFDDGYDDWQGKLVNTDAPLARG